MSLARNRWNENAPLPNLFTIYTDFQSAGHGMDQNRWFSEQGKNLLVSFYFSGLQIPANRQFLFNQYFALTTREFLSKYVDNVLIKWPNDIYVDGKKLAGDLTEHNLRGDKLQFTVAGIGINVNQDVFPADVPHPTSLFLETQRLLDVDALLDEYWQMLEDKLYTVSLSHESALHQQYLQYLYRLDEKCLYLVDNQKMEAAIKDVDQYGRLLLEDAGGKLHACAFKEVVFL